MSSKVGSLPLLFVVAAALGACAYPRDETRGTSSAAVEPSEPSEPSEPDDRTPTAPNRHQESRRGTGREESMPEYHEDEQPTPGDYPNVDPQGGYRKEPSGGRSPNERPSSGRPGPGARADEGASIPRTPGRRLRRFGATQRGYSTTYPSQTPPPCDNFACLQ